MVKTSEVRRLPSPDRRLQQMPAVVAGAGSSEQRDAVTDENLLVLTGAGLREAGHDDGNFPDPAPVLHRLPAAPPPSPSAHPVPLPARPTACYQQPEKRPPEKGPDEPANLPMPVGPPVRMDQAQIWQAPPMAQGPPGPGPGCYGGYCGGPYASDAGFGRPHGPATGAADDHHTERVLHKLQWWPPGPQYPISRMTHVGSRWGYYPTCWRQWPLCAPSCPPPIPPEACYMPCDAADEPATGGKQASPELLPAPAPEKKPDEEPKKPASPAKG